MLSVVSRRRLREGSQEQLSVAFLPSKTCPAGFWVIKIPLLFPYPARSHSFSPPATCWLMSTCSTSPPPLSLSLVYLQAAGRAQCFPSVTNSSTGFSPASLPPSLRPSPSFSFTTPECDCGAPHSPPPTSPDSHILKSTRVAV